VVGQLTVQEGSSCSRRLSHAGDNGQARAWDQAIAYVPHIGVNDDRRQCASSLPRSWAVESSS